MIAKIYLKWIIAIAVFLVLVATYEIIALNIQMKEVKTDIANQKGFSDLLYDPENLVILHVSERQDYCRDYLNIS
ncbi:hypothetical protein KY332_00625 [Candidatus Woesearchaeota archaeon]|nr:hypothetical protein [Candidatus Woesearchaeota archaeon]